MPAPSGSRRVAGSRARAFASSGSCCHRLRRHWGLTSSLRMPEICLFLSGTLPVGHGKLAISGRLGENLSVKEGQEAARIASLNALAVAKQHLGDLDRIKKLVKLTVLIATTEHFTEHASVADGASNLFVQIFGRRGWPRSVGLWRAKPAYWRYRRTHRRCFRNGAGEVQTVP